MTATKRMLCVATLAACGFSGAALAQTVIVQQPAPMTVSPAPVVVAPAPVVVAPAPTVYAPAAAPVVVYQPGITVYERREIPATTRSDGTSLAEDKGP